MRSGTTRFFLVAGDGVAELRVDWVDLGLCAVGGGRGSDQQDLEEGRQFHSKDGVGWHQDREDSCGAVDEWVCCSCPQSPISNLLNQERPCRGEFSSVR
jgi:hypothetical protein